MLDGLDAIDWAATSHAYGPATDVPAMLRDLGAPDDATRGAALHAAWGSIYHQGTRYPATALAIPFVIELAAQPDAPGLPELLTLLGSLIAGWIDPVHGRATPNARYGETAALFAACEAAGAAAVPPCVRLLDHPGADVRKAAARVLAGMPSDTTASAIEARLEVEAEPIVRAMLAFALGEVDLGRLVERCADDPAPIVLVIVAMAGARAQSIGEVSLDILLTALSDDALDEQYRELGFETDGLSADAAAVIAALGPLALARARPALREELAAVSDFSAAGLVVAALAAEFGDAPVPADAAALGADQRALLETLAGNQALWSIGHVLDVLAERGLPAERAELADYLGIVIVDDPLATARITARELSQSDLERGLAAWRQVLALAADDVEALHAVVAMLIELGRDDEARAPVARLLERDPDDAAALFQHSVLTVRADELEPALASFTRAAALAEAAGDAKLLRLARNNAVGVLHRLGRVDSADDLSHRADHANSHYTLARAYARSGQPEPALAAIARALAIQPALAAEIAADRDFACLADDVRFRRLTQFPHDTPTSSVP